MKDMTPYRTTLQHALTHALRYLEDLDRSPVAPRASLAELRSRFVEKLPLQGLPPDQVIAELVHNAEDGVVGSAGGRFFGWVIGGSVPAALAADWLTSTWDQNAALYAAGPAEAIIEEVCGMWLKELLGLPATASFALVTGCQMAHVTCLAAARGFVLAQKNWDVEKQGLSGAPPIRIVASDQKHGTIERAARLLGLGTNSIVNLPVDGEGRLSAQTLEGALTTDAPTIVVLQAGDLNIGAFDPFEELIPLAHHHGAWVHIDGAFGLWAAASPEHAHLLKGAASADSWSTDGHKWLNVPFDSGYAFVAHPDSHRASTSYRASYLVHDEVARDPMDWTPEWSRRGRAVATYAAIRQLGRAGISDLISRTCRHAKALVTRIGALPGAELVWTPQINQGLVRYTDPKPGATDTDHDRRTDAVIEMVLRSGEAFFGGTTWRGKRCMRVSVCNWQTDENDVDRAVEAVRQALLR
ncbi:MAG TPA: aminotransferase class V-fold PLP-dependent enzyme [Bacteroidota bacterium]|nr:aminotransferase class V-fold PLP-dependent enzyme [Bacteroidota bacterium]